MMSYSGCISPVFSRFVDYVSPKNYRNTNASFIHMMSNNNVDHRRYRGKGLVSSLYQSQDPCETLEQAIAREKKNISLDPYARRQIELMEDINYSTLDEAIDKLNSIYDDEMLSVDLPNTQFGVSKDDVIHDIVLLLNDLILIQKIENGGGVFRLTKNTCEKLINCINSKYFILYQNMILTRYASLISGEQQDIILKKLADRHKLWRLCTEPTSIDYEGIITPNERTYIDIELLPLWYRNIVHI